MITGPGLEHLSPKKRLKAGTSQPGEDKAQDFINIKKYLKGQ